MLNSYSDFFSNPKETVDLYTRQCSIDVTAIDLAKMGSVFANGGVSPFSKQIIIDKNLVPNILSEMATAGLYENSGNWLYKFGLPAKSGVSGAILAVAPGSFH